MAGGQVSETLTELLVEVDAGPGMDAEEMARLTRRLRVELLDLDVHAVRLANDREAPQDSKAFGLLAVGGLVVRFLGQEVLKSIVDGARSWLTRQRCRSIKLTIDGDLLELTGASSVEQDRLIDLWVTRHADGS
jgi:hypothetical protein